MVYEPTVRDMHLRRDGTLFAWAGEVLGAWSPIANGVPTCLP